MEANESLRSSGSATPVTVTTAPTTPSASLVTLAGQLVGGVTYDAGDHRAVAAQLEAAVAGSRYIAFERLDSYVRLVLQMLGDTDANTSRQGIEDLYLVLPVDGGRVMLADAGRATWTFGAEQDGSTGLYLPTAVAFDSSGLCGTLLGDQADIQPYPASGYGRTGVGRPALLSMFDRGPALGVLRCMCRSSATGNDGVVGRHLRWR